MYKLRVLLCVCFLIGAPITGSVSADYVSTTSPLDSSLGNKTQQSLPSSSVDQSGTSTPTPTPTPAPPAPAPTPTPTPTDTPAPTPTETPNPNPSEPDEIPPRINTVSFDNDSVSPGETLIVTLSASDASRIVDAEVNLRAPGIPFGFEGGENELTLSRFERSGFDQDNIRLQTIVSDRLVNATYSDIEITLTDAEGNTNSTFISQSLNIDNPSLDPETSPPELEDVSILNDTVEPGQRLVTEITANDQSEITEINVELRKDFTGLPFEYNEEIRLTAETDSITQDGAGITRLSTTIPESQVSGSYSVADINLEDSIGNRESIFEFDQTESVQVINGLSPTDRTEPQVQNVTIQNESVQPGDELLIQFDVEDDSPVVSARADLFLRSNSPEDRFEDSEITIEKQRAAGLGDTIRLRTEVPQSQFNGEYELDEFGIDVTDAALNEGNPSGDFVKSVTVTGASEIPDENNGDQNRPRISNITALNETVQAGDQILITADVADESGIESVRGSYFIDNVPPRFGGQEEQEGGSESRLRFTLRDRESQVIDNGSVTLSGTVPEDVISGRYRLQTVEATDTAGNGGFAFGPEISPLTQIRVNGTDPESVTPTQPEITDVSVLDTTVESGSTIPLRIETADISQINNISAFFEPVVQQRQPGVLPEIESNIATDIESSTTPATVSIDLPESIPNGTIRLESVEATTLENQSVFFDPATTTPVEIGTIDSSPQIEGITFSFENIQEAQLPVLPPVGAAITDENTARITQATPAVETTNPISITYEGGEVQEGALNGNNESLTGVEPIRYIDIQTENLSNSTFLNNTIEFSVAKTTLQTLPGSQDDIKLYQYNGTGYESVPTSDPVVGSEDVRYTATHTELNRDLMIASEANIRPIASVTFENQTIPNGSATVTVETAQFGNQSVPGEEFVVVVHETTDGIYGGEIGAKVGESDVLSAGTQQNIRINLSSTLGPSDSIAQLTTSQSLVAMLHRANTTDDDGINHGPHITRSGSKVTSRAQVAVSPTPPLEIPAENALAINGSTVYTIANSTIFVYDIPTNQLITQYEAPNGTDRGLAYGNGSLWYSDANQPAFSGQILELNPTTGEVRSRIDGLGYDPYGLAYGDGSLWATQVTGIPDQIEQYSPDGSELGGSSIEGPIGDAGTGPSGVAYFNGSIWIGTGTVLSEFGTNGNLKETVRERSSGSGFKALAGSPTALYGPDSSGDLSVLASTQISASVTLSNQSRPDGSSTVTIESAQFGTQLTQDEEFVVVVHSTTPSGDIGAKVGESAVLSGGTQQNIEVDLSQTLGSDDDISELTTSQSFVAMLHRANTTDNDGVNHGAPILRDGSPVTARAFVEVERTQINSPITLGGAQVDGALRIQISDGNIAVRRYNEDQSSFVGQYFGVLSDSSDTAVYVDGTVYDIPGGGTVDAGGTELSVSAQYLTNDGNTVVTEFSDPGAGFTLVQRISYSGTQQFYDLSWEVTNVDDGSGTLSDVRLLHGKDTYLAGGDFGNGFWNPETNTIGVGKTVNGEENQLALQGITDPFNYQSAFYDTIDDGLSAGGLAGNVRTENHDNGYALEWRRDSIADGNSWTVDARESFTLSPIVVDAPSQRTVTGNTANLSFTVENIGSSPETLSFTTSGPSGWDITTPSNRTIAADSTEQVTVNVALPTAVPQGLYDVSLIASSLNGTIDSATAQTQVPGDGELVIQPPDQIDRIDPFAVQVVDETGQPVSDVPVTLNRGGTTANQTATTNATGIAILDLPNTSTAEVVTLTASPDELPAYAIGDQLTLAGIRDPGDLQLSNLSVTPSETTLDQPLTVTANLTNTNQTELTQTLTVTANETGQLTTTTVTIAGETTRTVTLTPSLSTLGTQTITLNDNTAGTVRIEENNPARARLSAPRVNDTRTPLEVNATANADVSVNLTNIGETPDQFTLGLSIGDVTQNQTTSEIAPNETRTVRFRNVTGNLTPRLIPYTLALSTANTTVNGDVSIGDNPGTGSLTITEIRAPSRVSDGDRFTISAQVANLGPNVTRDDLTLAIDEDRDGSFTDEIVDVRQRTLAPNGTAQVPFRATATGDGRLPFRLTTDSETVTGNISVVSTDFTTAVSTGDPHIVSFDGVAYDFHAAGEFILAREPTANDTGSLIVQARQEPLAGSDSIAQNTAVATVVDNQTVIIDVTDTIPLQINGSRVELNRSETVAVGNGTITRSGNTLTITYPGADAETTLGDEYLTVDLYSNRVDIELNLDPERELPVEGVFGPADGNITNDIGLPNGTALAQPPQAEQLYGVFRQSWRVNNSTTLFAYENDNGPETYYDPTIPAGAISLADLDPTERQVAEQRAIDAGLQPGSAAFRNAVLDLVITGDTSYLTSAQQQNTSADATRSVGAPTESIVRVEPTSASLSPGGTNSLNLTLERAPEGLAGYNLTVSIGDGGSVGTESSVRVIEATAPDIFNNSVTETTIGPDNQTVEIRATDINTVVEANETDISLGTITVAANETADVSEVPVTVSVSRIDDDSGSPIDVQTENGTVSVTEQPPLAEGLNPPTDPDGDGVFEDLNGNGRLDFNDVVVLFENLPDAETPFQDINENGRIDFDDIVELFKEI